MSSRRLLPVLALAALLGVAHLVATPALWPVDETSHVAYADHLVGRGDLPTIDTPIPTDAVYPGLEGRITWERQFMRAGRQDIWTSNHPPLPYAVQGAALALGRAAEPVLPGPDDGRVPLALARLTSVGWLLVGVWATTRLAFLLAAAGGPTRRTRLDPADVAYAAGALVAVTPTLSHLSGVVFNDVPAFAMSTVCLLVGARAAFGGLPPRRLAVVGLVAGAAALTRVSCLPAVAIMLGLAAYGWWRDPAALKAQERGVAAAVAVAALVPAGLFYARNILLYGDISAVDVLFEKFNRGLNDPLGELVGDIEFWHRLWNRMWADLTTGHWAVGLRTWITESLLLLLMISALLALVRAGWRLARRRTGAPPEARPDGPADPAPSSVRGRVAAALRAHPRRVVWVAASTLPLALVASAVQFHSAGGSLHGRYALGGHAVTATAIVLLLGSLPLVGRLLAVLVTGPILLVGWLLLESLLVYHPLTWDRTGWDLDLPQLIGRAPELSRALVLCAALVLLDVWAGHLRRRRGAPDDEAVVEIDVDDPDDGAAEAPDEAQGERTPRRSIRASAAS